VYGPVRTVVWQGSAGDRRPYADLTGKPEITKAKAHEECCGRAGSQSVRPAGQWIAKAELAPFNCDLQLHLEYRE
jgi:hypothetical protein